MTQIGVLATYLRLADFGEAMTLGEMNRSLTDMPRRDVLYLLADLNHRMDPHVSDLEFQVALAQYMLPRRFLPKATRLLSEGEKVTTYPQIVLNLALRALLSCRAGDEAGPPVQLGETERRQVGRLLLAEADLIDGLHVQSDSTSTDAIEAAIVEVTRSDLAGRLHWHPAAFEEAYEVLFRSLPALPEHLRPIDPAEVARDRLGMEFSELWAMSAFASMMAFGSEGCPVYPSAISYGDLKDPTVLDRWMDFWQIDVGEAEAVARQDLQVGSCWSFEAFRARPLLRLSEDCILPLRTTYLAEKATLNGAVWTILDALEHERRPDWLNTVGRAFESWMRERLRSQIGGVTEIVWEEDMEARWGQGQKCDAVIVYDTRAWLALDFVYRNPTVQTKVSGSYDDLVLDVQRAAIDKLRQIDATLQRAMGQMKTPKLLVPLVVVGGQFPFNPVTYQAFDDALAGANLGVVGTNARSLHPAVMESHDFTALLQAAKSLRKPAFRLVEQWQKSPQASVPFSTWLGSKNPTMQRERNDDWLEAAKSWLLRPHDDEAGTEHPSAQH